MSEPGPVVHPTVQRLRAKRLMRRKIRRLGNLGWKGWVLLGRRAAPWVLLAFALVQIKTLSDKVKHVEEAEFSQVQTEVKDLKDELIKMRKDVAAADRTVDETERSLEQVNLALDKARKHTPDLLKSIDEVHAASEALRSGLPSVELASGVSNELKSADGQLSHLLSTLPSSDSGAALASGVTAVSHTVTELQTRLPDPGQAASLATAVAAQQKRLDSIGAALPKPDDAVALGKAIDADAQALVGLHGALPSEGQLQELRADVSKTLALGKSTVVPKPAPEAKAPTADPKPDASGSAAHATP